MLGRMLPRKFDTKSHVLTPSVIASFVNLESLDCLRFLTSKSMDIPSLKM